MSELNVDFKRNGNILAIFVHEPHIKTVIGLLKYRKYIQTYWIHKEYGKKFIIAYLNDVTEQSKIDKLMSDIRLLIELENVDYREFL